MSEFAKIFDSDKFGQILVKEDTNEEGRPELRFFVCPEGFGVCSAAIVFDDSETGWDKADVAFEKTGLEQAETMAEQITKVLQ